MKLYHTSESDRARRRFLLSNLALTSSSISNVSEIRDRHLRSIPGFIPKLSRVWHVECAALLHSSLLQNRPELVTSPLWPDCDQLFSTGVPYWSPRLCSAGCSQIDDCQAPLPTTGILPCRVANVNAAKSLKKMHMTRPSASFRVPPVAMEREKPPSRARQKFSYR